AGERRRVGRAEGQRLAAERHRRARDARKVLDRGAGGRVRDVEDAARSCEREPARLRDRGGVVQLERPAVEDRGARVELSAGTEALRAAGNGEAARATDDAVVDGGRPIDRERGRASVTLVPRLPVRSLIALSKLLRSSVPVLTLTWLVAEKVLAAPACRIPPPMVVWPE